jgi:hypothetical protein
VIAWRSALAVATCFRQIVLATFKQAKQVFKEAANWRLPSFARGSMVVSGSALSVQVSSAIPEGVKLIVHCVANRPTNSAYIGFDAPHRFVDHGQSVCGIRFLTNRGS